MARLVLSLGGDSVVVGVPQEPGEWGEGKSGEWGVGRGECNAAERSDSEHPTPNTLHPPLSGPETARRARFELNASAEALRRLWRDEVRHRPPSDRKRWLASQEAYSAIGAKRCKQILRQIDTERAAVAVRVPGAAWLDAWEYDGKVMPAELMAEAREEVCYGPGGLEITCPLCEGKSRPTPENPQGLPCRECATSGLVSIGTPARRRTPWPAVELEDELDAMSEEDATWYRRPASPSAVAIANIGCFGRSEERPKRQKRKPMVKSKDFS
jgi:hypothetical protein